MTRAFLFTAVILICISSYPAFSYDRQPEKTVEELIALLNDPDHNVRGSAIRKLSEKGTEAVAAVDALIEALDDEYSSVATSAARALGAISREPKVLEALIAKISPDDFNNLGATCMGVIYKFGESAVDAVPVLIELLDRGANLFQEDVIKTLGAIGPQAVVSLPVILRTIPGHRAHYVAGSILGFGDAAIPYLIDGITDARVGSRECAATVLGEFGEKASDAIPLLMEALREDDLLVAAAAAKALGKMDPRPDVLELLIDTLHYEDYKLRYACAEALGIIGPQPGVVDALIIALDDDDKSVRTAVVMALGEMGADAEPAVPLLIRELENGDRRAVQTFGNIGPGAKDAVPAIVAAIDIEYMGTLVINALRDIGEGAQEGVDGLIVLLNHEDAYIRQNVINALGGLGARAEDALQRLREIAASDDAKPAEYGRTIGESATNAISKIEAGLAEEPETAGDEENE